MAVSNLSPWQDFLSKMFPGKNVQLSPQQFEQAALQFFGPIPIPPGSQIISQSASGAEYIDAEGYRHSIRRSLDGRDPNAGQVQDNTNRPAILPPAAGQQQLQQGLTSGVGALSQQQLQNALSLARGETPPAFALRELDPQTAAALEAISRAEQAQQQEQFQRDQGTLLANLFGNRIQQSNIATDAAGRLLENQGRLTLQQLANAAQRNLGVRQFITQNAQQGSQDQTNALLSFLNSLTQQGTQRDIAGGQLGLGYNELAQRQQQANQQFELGQQQADIQLAQQRSALNKVLKATQIAANIASLAGGGISAYGALTGGSGGGIPMPRGIGPILTPPYNSPYIPR